MYVISRLALVCAGLLGSATLPLGESQEIYGKCNQTIIKEIARVQCYLGRTGRNIKKADGIVFYTKNATKDYLSSEVTCSSSRFTWNGDQCSNGTFCKTYTNGTVGYVSTNITENCGVVGVESLNIRRYVIIHVPGVHALLYICSTSKTARTDVPAVFLYKLAQGCSLTSEHTEELTYALTKLDCGEMKEYPECPTCFPAAS